MNRNGTRGKYTLPVRSLEPLLKKKKSLMSADSIAKVSFTQFDNSECNKNALIELYIFLGKMPKNFQIIQYISR